MSDNDAVIEARLKPLAAYLRKGDLEEINCNAPGELVLQFADGRKSYIQEPAVNKGYWLNLCLALANKGGAKFDLEGRSQGGRPQLSTRLPGGHRFEALLGHNVVSGISVSIRIKRRIGRKFADWGIVDEPALPSAQAASRAATMPPAEWGTFGGYERRLIAAAERGENVIVTGGTASGKTSLLQVFLNHIPRDVRQILVQDTEELESVGRDKVSILVNRHADGGFTYAHAFDHLMRSRPERLGLGELSIPNAYPFLLFLDQGHRGLFASAHSDGAEQFIEYGVYQRLSLAGHKRDREDVAKFLREQIDLIVHVARAKGGSRRLVELWDRRDGYLYREQGRI